jgi:hypothetical protein
MKSIAYSKFTNEYSDATVESEQRLGDRRADILVEFPEPRFPKGRGIGVEVQHKHEDKDVDAVTAEYHEEGYSVLWLEDADFSGYNVDLSGVIPTWPHAIQHDFSDGYHNVIHWLRQSKPANPSIDVVFPREYIAEHGEELSRAWHYGNLKMPYKLDDIEFWWLSDSKGDQKWLRLAETPGGAKYIQLGSGTEHVIAPVQIDTFENGAQIRQLARKVNSTNTLRNSQLGEWTTFGIAQLESGYAPSHPPHNGIRSPWLVKSIKLRLGSTSYNELALTLMLSKSDNGQITVITSEFDKLEQGLQTLAGLVGCSPTEEHDY